MTVTAEGGETEQTGGAKNRKAAKAQSEQARAEAAGAETSSEPETAEEA